MYVFDTSAFSQLFRNYYRKRFPTLWQYFDNLLKNNKITSTREVKRELEDAGMEVLRDWVKRHQNLFPAPTADEGEIVKEIFRKEHFQSIIERKKLLKGGKNADPFIIARAKALKATVVTMEKKTVSGVKIPDICQHFGIACTSLEGFMEVEGWRF